MGLTPQPLPANPFQPGPYHGAYEQCLILERNELWNQCEAAVMSPKMVARVLGHALIVAPSESGRDVLAREIMSCRTEPNPTADPELMAGLAYLYVYGLMRVFYNPNGPISSVSRGSPLLAPSPSGTPSLRDRLFGREERCCCFTGAMDSDTAIALYEAGHIESKPTKTGVLQVAHIISQSLGSESKLTALTPAAADKFDWATSAATVIERFGGFDPLVVLGKQNLNSPANAFLVDPEPHHYFDSLDLWLTPVKDNHGETIPHTYKPQYASAGVAYIVSVQPTVTFQEHIMNHEGTAVVVPPPSPEIIALHAACAQVAHLSGAMEHLHDLPGDSDDGAYTDTGDYVQDMMSPRAAVTLIHRLNGLRVAVL